MQSQEVILLESRHPITIRFKVIQNCDPALVRRLAMKHSS